MALAAIMWSWCGTVVSVASGTAPASARATSCLTGVFPLLWTAGLGCQLADFSES
jgi:hypothetical protein